MEICDNICFDKFHETLCDEIIKIYKRYNIEFYYGQAQKWVNMTMKYLCVIGEKKYPWLKKVYSSLHVPIDRVILNQAINEFKIYSVIVNGDKVSLKNLSWSRIKKEIIIIYLINFGRTLKGIECGKSFINGCAGKHCVKRLRHNGIVVVKLDEEPYLPY